MNNQEETVPFGMKKPLYTSSFVDEWGTPKSHLSVIPIDGVHGIPKPYLWVLPYSISSILYTEPRYTEDAACRRTWVAGLFRPQNRALLAPVFAHPGRAQEPGRGNSLMIQSSLYESVKNPRRH